MPASRSVVATLAVLIARELRSLEREVEGYPNDDAPWRAVPGTPNAGGTLVLHLAGNLQHYVGTRLGGDAYRRDRDAEFSRRGVSRRELVAELRRASAVVERVLPGLDDATLDADYPETVGGHTLRTGDFLLHLLAHLAYHLGQVDYHRRAVTGDGTGVNAIALGELAAG